MIFRPEFQYPHLGRLAQNNAGAGRYIDPDRFQYPHLGRLAQNVFERSQRRAVFRVSVPSSGSTSSELGHSSLDTTLRYMFQYPHLGRLAQNTRPANRTIRR